MRNTNYLTGNLFSLLLLWSTAAFSQTLMKDGIETRWNAGEITLEDGKKLKGLVRFNQVNGLITFKESKESKESKTIKEIKVFSLVMVDSTGKQRKFQSLQYSKDNNDILLFEILKEFKDWAILARKEKAVAIEGKNDVVSTTYGPAKNNRAVFVQEEGIFAMNQEGNLEKFQSTLYIEKDGLWNTSRHNSKIDKKILKKFMGSNFDKVEAFVKQNKLALDERENLLKALDYYEQLLSAE